VIDQSTGLSVTGATLSGTAIGNTMQVGNNHNFGPWVLGTTSGAYGTTLSFPANTAPGSPAPQTANVTYAYASGSDTSDFTLTSPQCPSVFVQGTTPACSLTWTFSPQATGARSAVYNITATDATTGQPITLINGNNVPVTGVTLSGNGQANAAVSVASSVHNFGEQGVGGTSAVYGTVVYNTTGHTITLAVGGTNANFPAYGNGTNCAGITTLTTNSSCNLAWTFTPTAPGTLSVDISITANGGSTPITDLSSGNTITGIMLSGTGVN
jgi:hypothetical protein